MTRAQPLNVATPLCDNAGASVPLGAPATPFGRCLRPALSDGEWRGVVGFPRYWVSAQGLIYSTHKGRLLNPYPVKGYPRVALHGDHGRKIAFVHTLVAEAFHGPRPLGMDCAHLDGDRLNNAASNLAWVTRSENEAHKRLHGRTRAGGNSPHAKLTDEQASLVRAAVRRSLTRREVAILAGVSEQIIEGIIGRLHYVEAD